MKFIKKIPIALNFLLAFLFLIGCLLPWLSPKYFWLLGFVGFAFPYIAIILFITILFWLFIKPKYSLFLFIILCFGYKQITSFFAFNTNTTFKIDKPNFSIRIATFNIGSLSARAGFKGAKKYKSEDVLKALFDVKADIICLQEFLETRERQSPEYVSLVKKYPNVYFPFWQIGPYKHRSGSLILSKYPIVFSDSLVYDIGENILRADVIAFNDTLSIFSTHFNSFQFSQEQLKEIDVKNKNSEERKSNWKGIARKVKEQLKIHEQQAVEVNEFIAKTQHPYIFCGDLNEVPNNYVYWKLRENKQDAFLQKGFGFGKSFNTLSALLRIDYIMPNDNFKVHQFNLIEKGLSDHAILVADVELNKKHVITD